MINVFLILITFILVVSFHSYRRFILKLTSKKFYINKLKNTKLKWFPQIHEVYIGIILAIISYIFSFEILFNISLGIAIADLLVLLIIIFL